MLTKVLLMKLFVFDFDAPATLLISFTEKVISITVPTFQDDPLVINDTQAC